MQKLRGLYTTELWVAALVIALIVLLAADAGRDAQERALFAIALVASTYIGGRCLIEAAWALSGRRLGSEPGSQPAELAGRGERRSSDALRSWHRGTSGDPDPEDLIDAALR